MSAWPDSRHIGAIVIHPANPNIVYVAALGHAYGSNEERGIFRTTDGGATWKKVLYVDDKTGGIDVVFDPHNPNTLFAAMWQAVRTPWSLSSGGPGSGLYRSTDGGNTWKKLEGHGLPEGWLGKIGVTVSGADSSRVYALIEAKEGGIYRSEDGGDTWTKVNDDERYRQRAWYFTHIFADPKSVDTCVCREYRPVPFGGWWQDIHPSAGAAWRPSRVCGLTPRIPGVMIDGNDGGATVSVDGGETWSTLLNQPTAQFYHVITDNQFPYYVYGAQQDNSSVGIASYCDDGVIARQNWFDFGGETGFIAPYAPDPNIIYGNNNESALTAYRFDRRTQQTQDISVWPLDVSGHGAEDLDGYRFAWTSPLFISTHDPNAIYTSGNRIFKSTDAGMTWTAISKDLTRNDKSKQKPSGGPITLDITSRRIL